MNEASKVARGLLATKEKRLSISLPAEIHQELKLMAATNSTTIKDLIIEAQMQYLRKHYPVR